MVTVENQTTDDWKDVEIWVNQYFRVTAPSIVAGSTFQAPLDSFVSGYAQRFDVRRIPVNDVRLTAKRLTGDPIQLKLERQRSGLAALGGKK